jgi:hypothetical protein
MRAHTYVNPTRVLTVVDDCDKTILVSFLQEASVEIMEQYDLSKECLPEDGQGMQVCMCGLVHMS